jgi:hypothetical protein
MMADQFQIRNWQKFQHYNKRNPPWIKLHYEIMTSEDWVVLDDASKLLAVACMLIASRNDGCVPNNPSFIKRVAYLEKTPNLKPLVECGFLEKVLADASKCERMQADATPEAETEAETETEKKPTVGRVNATAQHPHLIHESSEIRKEPKHDRPTATMLDQDWQPTDGDIAYARERGFTRPEIDDMAASFGAYFRDGPGRTKAWTNWHGGSGAWGTWVRNEWKRHRPGNGTYDADGNQHRAGGGVVAAVRRVIDQKTDP